MQDADRPSPDALLAAAAQESRGRLKIFLGAAPGVGKTYAMLQAAQRARREGVDVVVGVVETHGRTETEALIAGLEVVPRRIVTYKGRSLDEMDLDAILARRPQLVLVDELAHTNAPGSRHPKRFLDVEELRNAGIDVFTTVNVQHIESLNDIVAQITRIRVRETVPDSIVAGASDVALIDLSPDELIKRLHDGKVYVREQAERAVKHYFQPGNLTALRELALRRAAQRVDEQMLDYMQAHAIKGPWAASDRVLVCLGDPRQGDNVVRYGKRIADTLKAPWTAIYIQTTRHLKLRTAERDAISTSLRLAEHLGAEAETVVGSDIAHEILAFARDNNFTHIVVGKSKRRRWSEVITGSVVHDLARDAGGMALHVLPAADDTPRLSGAPAGTSPSARPFHYVASTGATALALGLGLLIDRAVAPSNVSFVFLAAVLLSAASFGMGPALWSVMLSVLAYNFFFLPPLYTLTISDPANVIALVFFGLAAGLTSWLASQMRDQAEAARREARITAALYAFSRKLTENTALDNLLLVMAHQIYAMLRLEVVLLVASDEKLEVRAAWPPEDKLDAADLAAAQWCWDRRQRAGRGADTLPGAKRLFVPLLTARGPVGVMGLHRQDPGDLLAPEDDRLLNALVDISALTLERVRFSDDIERARILAESERLRMALLSSISHDLKTPLSSIMGTISGLKHYGAMYDEATRDEMLATALREAERLNRFVDNLLDMTRIDSGSLRPKADAIDLDDIVNGAVRRASRQLEKHHVVLSLANDLPPARLDPVLMETALVNVLENAAKYAPEGTEVSIATARDNEQLVVTVTDEGPGIPEDQLGTIFDKFHRVAQSDRQKAGTGLGLSIAKGFLEAMGGTIVAANRADGAGATFRLSVPVAAALDHAA